MKILGNLFLSFTLFSVLFFGCSSENNIKSNYSIPLFGKWYYDTGKSYLSGEISLPIIAMIEFKDDNTYNVSTLNLPDNFPLFIEPNISGDWVYTESENKIKFFQAKTEIALAENFIFYWEIIELTKDLLKIRVLDKAENVLYEREYLRKE